MADSVIVRAEHLADYLALHGLRVVRASWPKGAPRPLLILGPAQAAPVSDAQPPAEPERKESKP